MLQLPTAHDFSRPPARRPLTPPVALLFSPHPDDEVITGALPLRLQRELGMRVVNIAVTLGSKPVRRAVPPPGIGKRPASFLAGKLEIHGWTELTPEAVASRISHPQRWPESVVEILERWQPRWVFYPHAGDAHPTHRAVHLLVARAPQSAKLRQAPPIVGKRSDWHPLANPNLLVELPAGAVSAAGGGTLAAIKVKSPGIPIIPT